MVNADAFKVPIKNRCREIEGSDIDAVVTLLTRGFPTRTASYWRRALARLEAHPTPPGYPKFGYLLESEGAPVGVILLIFAAIEAAGELRPRCYLSSWYVEPAFRAYASLLVSVATKDKHVTYVNVSPDPRTWPIIEAQGFSRYSRGQYRAAPLLSWRSENGRIREVRVGERAKSHLDAPTLALLADHAEHNCLSLICEARDGEYPFVFQVRRIGRDLFACAQLIYCRDIADVARFAQPLGLFLARRGILCVSIDSNGRVQGLVGRYFEGRAPKYFKGPDRPRPGDLAYTESVLLEP
jgi:hypothetical protein